MRWTRVSLWVASLLTLGSCAAVNSLFEADKTVRNEAAKAVGGSATCCVNKQFYECPDALSGTQCLGEPIQLGQCVDKCPASDQSCTLKCMADHGPDPSHCTRAPTRDGECK